MIFRKAYKYRLYPNVQQQAALAIQFGHARFVYNHGLAMRKEHYVKTGKGLSYNGTAKALTRLKKELDWLKQADSQVLQQSLKNLDRAYVNFFKGRARYPRFKKSHAKQSIRYPQRFKFNDSKVCLPKVGSVRFVQHREMIGTAKNITVSKTKTGKYFVSVQCEYDFSMFDNGLDHVGVDLGLTSFAILSTGEKIDSPKFFRKSERKLAVVQRRLSRRQKGGKNRTKALALVARIHEKIASQRKDFLDKLSHRLTTQYGVIGLESLNVKGMIKNKKLAKSISDSGWGMFVQMIEYKSVLNGATVCKADRFFPSSKLCNVCSNKKTELKLSVRKWKCQQCGSEHDRDINAAKNLRNLCTTGPVETNACGDLVRLETCHGVEQ